MLLGHGPCETGTEATAVQRRLSVTGPALVRFEFCVIYLIFGANGRVVAGKSVAEDRSPEVAMWEACT